MELTNAADQPLVAFHRNEIWLVNCTDAASQHLRLIDSVGATIQSVQLRILFSGEF